MEQWRKDAGSKLPVGPSLSQQNTHAICGRPEEVFLRIKDYGGDAKFISAETASKLQLLEVEFILHCSKLTHHAIYGADIDGLTRS